jgi:hypothetical protein
MTAQNDTLATTDLAIVTAVRVLQSDENKNFPRHM